MNASNIDETVCIARGIINKLQRQHDACTTEMQILNAKQRIAAYKLDTINFICGQPFAEDVEAGVLAIAILTIIAK